MDCGGSCPPCGYIGGITDEVMITNTAQLSWEVKAFNKITAGVATTVASGETVSFITKPTGSIFLLPGFTAEEGSTFRTQTKDLPKRFCGGICYDYTLSSALTVPSDELKIYNLLYAVEMRYDIYRSNEEYIYGEYIYSYIISNIERDGNFVLWDCLAGTGYDGSNVPTGRKYYKMKYSIYYCKGAANLDNKEHNFYVDYCYENSVPPCYQKSLPEDSVQSAIPPQFPSPNPDNTPLQSATAPPNFAIIPNPNSGAFQLETNFPLSEIGALKITNPLGITVYEDKKVTEHTIQLQNAASGMYFVVIVLKDGNVLRQKMMVQK
jgi:hypothetical protein